MTSDGSRFRRSVTDPSSDEHILDTRLAPMRPMPMARGARLTFLAGTPSAAISGTAAMTARSTREYR